MKLTSALSIAAVCACVAAWAWPAAEKHPSAKVKRAPDRKWTELVVRGKDAELCRRIAKRFTDSPTQELKVYDQGHVWPTNKLAAEFVLPWWNTNALCQIETTPRGLSPVGQLDLISLAPEDSCDSAWANFVFHSYAIPNRFEHWKNAGCCAAWHEE